jgi:hypothetical protein
MVSAKIKNSVIDKVNTGIPFELLAIVSENEKPKCHRSLQIQLSLWDKKIRISDGEKLLARAGNDDFSELICRNLVCQNNVSPHGLGKVRVYLNPNWTGRLERLKARTSGLNTLLYSIDWEDFSKEKNKDSFIFEEDLIP